MRQVRMDSAWLDARWDHRDGRNELRRRWERLLSRARFLNERDRTFLELAAEQDGRISRLSRLTHQSPAALARRIRDITRRLTACEIQAVLDHPDAFTPFEKACICEHLVRNHPLARAAGNLNTSIYMLRKTIADARATTRRLSGKQQSG